MSKTRVGFALTGSYCTFQRVFRAVEQLVEEGYEVTPILSFSVRDRDTRFYSKEAVRDTLLKITGKEPIATMQEAEPIGPRKLLDAYVIAPMTGASLGRMAHGIFDTPALLGAKSHLRNGRPVLIAPSTNDGLSTSAENIGKILVMRNVYFVPFGQDDPVGKPRSLVADFDKISAALSAALAGAQLQPMLYGNLKKG
ncbi:MAG: dipicolinate synthase subunit B [Clostridia bacterium]|nr:dipicolinate synthase subunit B [Clostridia bacterium]MBR6753024.1 dipicolinate synthase subunit B [Clostridia bacterium]